MLGYFVVSTDTTNELSTSTIINQKVQDEAIIENIKDLLDIDDIKITQLVSYIDTTVTTDDTVESEDLEVSEETIEIEDTIVDEETYEYSIKIIIGAQ